MKESKSQSITVRVPNELMKAVYTRAIARGMVEIKPDISNLAIAIGMDETKEHLKVSEVVQTALKMFAEMESSNTSNTVGNDVRQELDKLKAEIEQNLQTKLEALQTSISEINLESFKTALNNSERSNNILRSKNNQQTAKIAELEAQIASLEAAANVKKSRRTAA